MQRIAIKAFALTRSDSLQWRMLGVAVALGAALWIGLIARWSLDRDGLASARPHAATWRLTSICTGNGAAAACINGCWVGVGDKLEAHLDDIAVVNIDGHQVLLDHRGEPQVLRIYAGDGRWDDMVEDTP